MNGEHALASPETGTEYNTVVLTPEGRAEGIAAHWRAFEQGSEPAFYRYFMLEVHGEDRNLFLATIDASPEIPYPDDHRQAVLKTGRAILYAATQSYDNGEPFAVEYIGARVYPIE